MIDTRYTAELLTPEQSEVVYAKHLGKLIPTAHKRIITPEGLEIKGSFELKLRDAKSGQVELEHKQDNLITDFGRRHFSYQAFMSLFVGFCPSRETPQVPRYSLPTDVTQTFDSQPYGEQNGVVTVATHTKQLGPYNFATPPSSNRTLGTIFLFTSGGNNADIGPLNMLAYALLSPARVQTTTQTLEVIYKFSMTPIY